MEDKFDFDEDMKEELREEELEEDESSEDDGEEKKEEKPMTSLEKARANLKEALSWLLTLVIVIVFTYLLSRFVILKAEVPTSSMKNTINEDDQVIGLRIVTKIERGDIVIFPALEYVGDGEDVLYVKRVIGLPGDVVEIKNGAVFVNDVELKEDYLPEEMRDENLGPYYVPDDSYFLLGDNRNISKDARVWTLNKFVKKKDIKAKVIFKYYPEFEFFKDPVY